MIVQVLYHSDNNMERSNTGKSNNTNAEAGLFIQKALRGMKELTQTQKNIKGIQHEIKLRKLNQINKNLELAARRDPSSISVFRQNTIFIYIKHFFLENVPKAPALTFLRLLIPSQPDTLIYLNNHIPIFVVRVLERDQSKQRNIDWEEDATEALKLIAEWINHHPNSIPRIFITTVVCFAELPAVSGFEEKKKDHIPQQLKLLAIDILLSLTVHNLELCLSAGAFSLLINSITDPSLHQRSQDILLRILYFMNEQSTRQKIWAYVDLKKIFSVFTDLDCVFIEESSKNKGNIDFISRMQTQLALSKQALLTLLKSWNGIILLANDPSILSTVLEALRQIPKKQDSQIRKTIYSLLEELLQIGQGLIRENTLQHQNDFRASSLLSSYIIDLLRLLMNHDLFKLLIELSGIDEKSIFDPAQRLLKKLSIYIFNFLPHAANYMDFLVSAGAKKGPNSNILKHSSSFIVSKIGNYVFEDTKQGRNPFLSELQYLFNPDSLFVPLKRSSIVAVSKNLNFLAYKQIPNYRRKLLDLKPIPKDYKQNFKKWDWNVIIDLLSFPDAQKEGSRPDTTDRHKEFKLFKYLLRFYSPLRGSFAEQKWSIDNLIYIKAGKLVIMNTLIIPDNLSLIKEPPQDQFEISISFIGQLEKTLQNALLECSKNSSLYNPLFFKTLERQLLLWIGSLTLTKPGYEELILRSRFFQLLFGHLHLKQCSFIIAGIMFFMDFYRESKQKRYDKDVLKKSVLMGPKALLWKCVTQGSKYLKLMSIQMIKILYKGELTGFSGQGFKMLLNLVGEDGQELWKNAVETIQELLKDRQLLDTFLSILIEKDFQKFNFEPLKQKFSSGIFIRLVGRPSGFTFVQEHYPNWLQSEYQKWVKPESSQPYFQHLEQLLNNCLNFSHRNASGYRIETKSKHWLQWSFLYKLPWLLYVNDTEDVPLLIRIQNDSLLLSAELDRQEYDFRSQNSQNNLRVCLGIGAIFLDQGLLPTKTKKFTSVNLNDNKLVTLYNQEYYCSTNKGVSVYFLLKPRGQSFQEVSQSESYANHYDIRRIHIQIKLSSYFQIEELPLHLMQELTKTQMGMEFLQNKKLTQHAKQVLVNHKSTALDVRSVLWSLGYYGSTKEGFNRLAKEGIIKQVISMSMNCPTLSLRGTCRYVMNMLCHSQEGRNYLNLRDFTVNKTLLSCFPTDPNMLFKLQDDPLPHVSQNQSLWQEYKQSLLPLNENEKKLFDAISLLINSLSSKYAITQLKEMMKNSSKVVCSFDLLQNVVNLLSYFKMKYESRKTIHFIFEEFLKSNEFVNDDSGRIDFPLEN